MQITVAAKWLRLAFVFGADAAEVTEIEFVQLSGGDLSIADEVEPDAQAFGFTSIGRHRKPNTPK